MKHFKIILMLLLSFSFTGFAQQRGDYSKEPGYYDFENILSLKSGDTITEVCLEEQLLKMVAQMGDSKDEDMGSVVNGLKLVKVNEFLVDLKDSQKLNDAFDYMSQDLQSKKWNRIIKTRHNESLANVYVKSGADNNFSGLLITAVDKKGKVTLVNVVGKINPKAIGKLSKQFNFPNVDKMNEKEKSKED